MKTESTHVSWLALEKYYLGELRAQEKARVERALEESAELRSCLDQIRSDQARPLRPLPANVSRRSAEASRWELFFAKHIWQRRSLWGSAVALAACLIAIVIDQRISRRPPILTAD